MHHSDDLLSLQEMQLQLTATNSKDNEPTEHTFSNTMLGILWGIELFQKLVWFVDAIEADETYPNHSMLKILHKS